MMTKIPWHLTVLALRGLMQVNGKESQEVHRSCRPEHTTIARFCLKQQRHTILTVQDI